MNYLRVVLFVCVQLVLKSRGSYYWKPYHNKIPSDAFKAGQSVDKEKIFIGQAFIKTDPYQGIYPSYILKGQDVFAPIFGASKADNFVQILCSNDPENFEWLPANSTHLHLLNTNNELVRGGIEDNKWLNIGRINYQGGTVIGKVLSGLVEGASMHFVYDGNEVRATLYEVLTYNEIASKISVRNNC